MIKKKTVKGRIESCIPFLDELVKVLGFCTVKNTILALLVSRLVSVRASCPPLSG